MTSLVSSSSGARLTGLISTIVGVTLRRAFGELIIHRRGANIGVNVHPNDVRSRLESQHESDVFGQLLELNLLGQREIQAVAESGVLRFGRIPRRGDALSGSPPGDTFGGSARDYAR